MMKKILCIQLGITMLFTACETKKEMSNESSQHIAQCLMAKDYKYEDLLTKEDIAKHVEIDEATFKFEISPVKGEYGSCSYEWKSDRPDTQMELLGQMIPVKDNNRVTLKMLSFYTDSELKLYNQATASDLFDQSYKKLSQQEYESLLANLHKEYANDAAGFDQAKGFLDARMKLTYQPIENLGSGAYYSWHEEHGIKLAVLAESAHFIIESKTSGNSKTALQDAVLFAKEVLAKCGA